MRFCLFILMLFQFYDVCAGLPVPTPTPTPIPSPLPVIDIQVLEQLKDEYGELETQEETLENQLDELLEQTELLQKSVDKQDYSMQWDNQKSQNLITKINGILESYSNIAYSAQNLDKNFQEYYPGYTETQDFQTQYITNLNDTLETTHGALQAINANIANISTEKTDLDTLHKQVENPPGQTAMLQTLTEMSEMMVTQMQALREIIASQANAQMSYYATQMQTHASHQVNLDIILAAGNKTMPVYGSNSENNIYSFY